MYRRTLLLALIPCAIPISAGAAEAGDVIKFVDSRYEQTSALARDLWEFAEVGYQEVKSSTLIKETLAAEGFEIESGIAGIPTAFVATFGSKGPIIGILAEYDALPGINQDDVPTRSPIEGKLAGQACGHNLFGAGSVGAAIAVKHWLEETGTPVSFDCTVRRPRKAAAAKSIWSERDCLMIWMSRFTGMPMTRTGRALVLRLRIAPQNFASMVFRHTRQAHRTRPVLPWMGSRHSTTWST